MKVRVMNDRTTPRLYCVNTLMPETSFVLKPQESKEVEIDAPEGSILFWKDWNDVTLISYIAPKGSSK